MDRRPLFLDPDTGLLTETSGANTIDLSTLPWLEELILDVARCKAALRFVGVEPDLFDPEPLTVGG